MTEVKVKTLIFDLDGTLVDSKKAVEDVWKLFAKKYCFDFENQVLPICHGRPSIYPLRELLPSMSESELQNICAEFEQIELDFSETLPEINGARKLLNSLPKKSWAIATSGSYDLASKRLKLAHLPVPEVFVTAEMVERAKPYPDPFLKAMKLLNVDPVDSIIFEDSKAGLQAAKASGAKVVEINISRYLSEKISCDLIINNYENCSLEFDGEYIVICFKT